MYLPQFIPPTPIVFFHQWTSFLGIINRQIEAGLVANVLQMLRQIAPSNYPSKGGMDVPRNRDSLMLGKGQRRARSCFKDNGQKYHIDEDGRTAYPVASHRHACRITRAEPLPQLELLRPHFGLVPAFNA